MAYAVDPEAGGHVEYRGSGIDEGSMEICDGLGCGHLGHRQRREPEAGIACESR